MPDIFNVHNTPVVSSIPLSDMPKEGNKKPGRFSLPKQLLSAYLFMPEGVSFETQEPGEPIILLLRRHWITNFVWVFTGLLLIFLPVILFPVVAVSGIIPNTFSASYISLAILVWYLLTFSYIFVNFLLWYFTVSIVTNERIVDIDFINVLYKKFAETRIARIEDVTNKTGGFIRAVFDYGDVIVQTAAREAMFLFGSVPHPERVVKIINGLMGKEEDRR